MHASVKAFKVPFTSLCKHSLRKANLDADVKSWPSVQKPKAGNSQNILKSFRIELKRVRGSMNQFGTSFIVPKSCHLRLNRMSRLFLWGKRWKADCQDSLPLQRHRKSSPKRDKGNRICHMVSRSRRVTLLSSKLKLWWQMLLAKHFGFCLLHLWPLNLAWLLYLYSFTWPALLYDSFLRKRKSKLCST